MWGERERRRRLASFVAIAAVAAMATAGTAGASTTSYAINETTPFAATVTACNGEPVAVSGTYHFESNYSITFDTTGISFHSQQIKKSALSGFGTVSGGGYQNEQEH